MNRQFGHIIGPIDPHQAIAGQPEQAVIRPHPEHAVVAFEYRAYKVVGEPLRRAVGTEHAAAVTQQTGAVGSRPEASVAPGEQTEDAVLANRWNVIAVVDHKPRAIEAHQSAARADPQVVVGGLGESLHGVLGKPVLNLPDTPRIPVRQSTGDGRVQKRSRRQDGHCNWAHGDHSD